MYTYFKLNEESNKIESLPVDTIASAVNQAANDIEGGECVPLYVHKDEDRAAVLYSKELHILAYAIIDAHATSLTRPRLAGHAHS